MDVEIRRAHLDDAEAIVGVFNPIIAARVYTAFDTPFTADAEREYIRNLPARSVFHVAVAPAASQIVGFQTMEAFATYTHAFDHVAVMGTFVDLRYRRQGIAAQLFRATLAAAVEAGYEKVFTFVRADNPAALQTYLRQGFRTVGTTRRQAKVDGRYVDEIIIEKLLAEWHDSSERVEGRIRQGRSALQAITGTASPLEIVEADLERGDHQQAVVDLTDAYAADPMGSGQPLSPAVRAALVPGLRAHATTLIFLAYQAGRPIGIATCFRGFSTFAARGLLNIHDLAVLPTHRGHGVGRQLLAAVEQKARALGCCKVTLEVQEDNRRARGLYEVAGFAQAVYAEGAGGALFFSKRL